jgi:hypothetical protein
VISEQTAIRTSHLQSTFNPAEEPSIGANIDADVLENLIKLGAVNLLRLKVDPHILNKASKIIVLLAELVDRFQAQQNLLAAGKMSLFWGVVAPQVLRLPAPKPLGEPMSLG